LPNSVNNDTVIIYPGERYGVMLSPSLQIIDSAKVEYINMNTHQVEAAEFVPVTINGFVSINEQSISNDFILYPNPANEFITIISNDKKEITNIEIFNSLGQKMQDTKITKLNNDALQVNVNGLSGGIYWVKIYSKDNYTKTIKFNITK